MTSSHVQCVRDDDDDDDDEMVWNERLLSCSEARVQEKGLQSIAALGADVGLVQPAGQVHSEGVPVSLPHYVLHDALLHTQVLAVGLEQITEVGACRGDKILN